jgi:hypothetical protein
MKKELHASINTVGTEIHIWKVSNPQIAYSLREGVARSLPEAMREIRKAKKEMA